MRFQYASDREQSLLPRQLELPLMPATDASAEVVQTSISPKGSCTSSTTSSLSNQVLADRKVSHAPQAALLISDWVIGVISALLHFICSRPYRVAQSLSPRQLELPLMPATDASAEVVQTSISPKGSCTSSTTSSLSNQVLADLKATLQARGMTTTEPQLEALADVVGTLCDMADGSCAPTIQLSSLDPGMGKTTALIHFLQRVVASPDHLDVGVLVCLSQLDEIQRLVDEAELDEADFAVFCSDDQVSNLSATDVDAAQVLFTTQQMLAKRCAGRRLSEVREFCYLGQARAVRVWDETIEPGKVITVSADELAAMLSPLRRINPVLADQVQALQFDLATSPPGQIFQMPALEALFAISTVEVSAAKDFRERPTSSLVMRFRGSC